MKKLLLFFVCFLFAIISKAQLGIQAGADLYASKITSNNISIKYNYKAGFTGGIFYSIPLKNDFSIMSGLDFVQKGGKLIIRTLVNGEPNSEVKSVMTLNYVQLPINIACTIKGFFIEAGPTFGFGLNGKEKNTGVFDSTNSTEISKVHFGNDKSDDLKRFELGANVIIGYRLKNGLFINAFYNPGLINIAPDAQGESKFHNSGFALRIGYFFNVKKKWNE